MTIKKAVTKKAIADHLEAIEKKGYIVRDNSGARAIRLVGYSVKLIKDEPEEGIFDGYIEIEVPIKIIVSDYEFMDFNYYFALLDDEGIDKFIEVPGEFFNIKKIEEFLCNEAVRISKEGIASIDFDKQEDGQ